MKILKYISIFFVSVLFLITVGAVIFLGSSGDEEEDAKREKIAIQIKSEIEYYYDQNKHYPKSLNALPISDSRDFASYHKDNIFRYSTFQSNNKSAYRLIWVYSGLLGKEGSPHRHSWSGKQCGNNKTFLELIDENEEPDANGFYRIDLH